MGGAYVALTPYFDRAAFGVGGAPYHLLLTRSTDFEPFFLVFKTMYPDARDIAYWLGLIQTLWDSSEGAGYLQVISDGGLPGSTPTRILQQVAIGDAQVTTLGAHIMARAHGAALIGEPARPVWGLETVAGPHEGSALVEWDYGLAEPRENVPPTGPDPHRVPRETRTGQDSDRSLLPHGRGDRRL